MRRLIVVAFTSLCFVFSSMVAFSAPSHKAKTTDKRSAVSKKQTPSNDKTRTAVALKTRNSKTVRKGGVEKDRKSSAKMSATYRSTRSKARAVEVVEETETDGEFIEYKVRKGDTLDNVALRFGLERDDIVESNNNLGKRLAPGRTLLIPRLSESDGESDYVDLSNKTLKSWKTREERYMLVKVAKSFMGAPYRYGGESVRGLDCSAFVKKIYDIFDVQLPRSAREQFHAGPKIQKEELAVGDLVFFRTKRYVKYPTHVGIYIGDGNFIHSSSAHCKVGVRIDSLQSDFYNKTFLGGARIKKSPEEMPETTFNPDIPFNYNYNS